jgi:hypothetical protein
MGSVEADGVTQDGTCICKHGLREPGNIMAATLYSGHYSGWTRSKQAAISAACKGSRDDMGGVEEEITAHRLTGPVTLAFPYGSSAESVGAFRVHRASERGRGMAQISER